MYYPHLSSNTELKGTDTIISKNPPSMEIKFLRESQDTLKTFARAKKVKISLLTNMKINNFSLTVGCQIKQDKGLKDPVL